MKNETREIGTTNHTEEFRKLPKSEQDYWREIWRKADEEEKSQRDDYYEDR